MKFEVKTHANEVSKTSISIILTFAIFTLIIILSSISIKIGPISRYYEINYLCRLLTIEKTSFNFKKLSKLTNQNTKKRMWDFCRVILD